MIQEYGKYIVAHPKICHGKLTFRGTRMFVTDALEMLADGMDWDAVVAEFGDPVCRESIADAIRYATQAFIEQNKVQRIPEALAA